MNLIDSLKLQSVIADGAMGTRLMEQGYQADDLVALLLKKPEVISAIHQAYVEAGADLIYTHTFLANTLYIEKKGLAAQMEAIHCKAVELARNAGARFVAGNMGPLCHAMFAKSQVTRDYNELTPYYYNQAKALVDAGVDLLALETFTDPKDLQVAIKACRAACGETSLLASVTVSSEGKFADGSLLTDFLPTLESDSIDLWGFNCMNPSEILSILPVIKPCLQWPVVFKPNAGKPKLDADQFASEMLALQPHGSIFGGCCGTTPEYINKMKGKLTQPLSS
jgi:5-methyltetrahydrofolate--homocysteine methyltransferase